MLSSYYDLEELAMMHGLEPQNARFRVQLGQAKAETFIPTLDILTPEEAAQQASQGGPPSRAPSTPGAVPVRPERWDLNAQPLATYRLAFGDTLTGLAITYLGRPTPMEIWAVQTPEYKSQRTPDQIFVEDVIRMPEEARTNMRAFLALGQPSGQRPGELTTTQKKTAKAKSLGKYALIGAGALGAGYLLYKSFV